MKFGLSITAGLLLCSLTLAVGPVGAARAQDAFQDALVQPPGLTPPQRGSIAGSLARFSAGAGQLSRGALELPLPIELPSSRSLPLVEFLPSYSIESGASEWGMGWSANLEIRRHRMLGDVRYDDTDEYTSPWGRLVRGNDGYFYPAGMRTVMRLELRADGGWLASASDGTRYTFLPGDAVATPRGVYAWKLSHAESVLGDVTTLEWRANDTGRRFLETAAWGSRQRAIQYEVRFSYESVAHPLVSYATGGRQLLDRRIISVALLALDDAGAMRERWSYQLSHVKSPLSPTFYLSSIQRRFGSGTLEPLVKYEYDTGLETLHQAALRPEPSLDKYMKGTSGDGLSPDRVTLADLDEDSILELEHHYSNTLLRRSGSSYEFEPLPARPADANVYCRQSPNSKNEPRVLARMRPDTAEPSVVSSRQEGSARSSRIDICDRVGRPIAKLQVPGVWNLGARTRLVDLDSDRRADFISVSGSAVEVLPNSSSAEKWSFEARRVQRLRPEVNPTASWVADLNGDTHPDIVSRISSGLVVWYGMGNFEFDTQGQFLTFEGERGASVHNINLYNVTFGDLNGDGMSDVLLTRWSEVHVFLNQLDHLFEVRVPGLSELDFAVEVPRLADLSGSGNAEILLIRGEKALSVALNSPSTGLLRSVDDGKGTTVAFSYVRAAPARGLGHRPSVLSSVTVTSGGTGTVVHTYEYGPAVVHSRGHFLLGFEAVTRSQRTGLGEPALVTTQTRFHHDDDVSGVTLGSTLADARVPGIEKFTQLDYEAASFHGVPWRRLRTTEEGLRSTASDSRVVATSTAIEAYARGICPVRTVITAAQGVLVKELELDALHGLPADLQCLERSRVLSGLHDDGSLDFEHKVVFERNELGQLLRAVQEGPSGPVVLQESTYGEDHLLASTGSPATGVTRFVHDAFGRLARVTAPDGRVTRIGAFDSVSDTVKEFREERGHGVAARYFFDYDGMERLATAWDDFSGSIATNPSEHVRYTFATADHPGRVDLEQLVDASAGINRRTAELMSADGHARAGARFTGQWLLSRVGRLDAASDTEFSYEYGPLDGSLEGLDFADLFAGGEEIGRRVTSAMGFATEAQTVMQSNVLGGQSTTWQLLGGELVQRSVEVGGGTSELVFDDSGQVIRARDELGAEWRYTHDVLGRLVQVTTPDGTQRLKFDWYGRTERVERSGLLTITYAYDAVTGQRVEKRVLSSEGVLQRVERTSYDASGRPLVTTQVAGASSTQVRYDYDGSGSLHDGGTAPGQLGQLSRVRTEQYERRQLSDVAGRVVSSTETLGDGWREVNRELTYRAGGDVHAVAVTVRDEAREVVHRTRMRTELDAYGRSERGYVDDELLYTMSYGSRGGLDRVIFSDGHVLTVQYDATTNRRMGYAMRGSVQDGGVSWEFDARGQVASERHAHGASSVDRSYQYDVRGYLERSIEGAVESTYAYSPAGSPLRVADALGEHQVERGTRHVGDSTYGWDEFGRVDQRDDLTIGYGANGELAVATHGSRELRYYYDEANRRVLKIANGVPERAWIAGGVVTDTALYLPVVIDGILVGVLENSVFRPVITDERGTPTTTLAGEPSLATAYGARVGRDSLAEVVDFARLGYDADLGTVRMGVRDYDPKLSQFWTPDPRMLEDLAKCQASPVECGLYGYAANDPLAFADPAGTSARDIRSTSVDALKDLANFFDGVVSGLNPFDDQREDPVLQVSDKSELIWHAGRLVGSTAGLVGDAFTAAAGTALAAAGAPLLVAGGAGAVPVAAGAAAVGAGVLASKGHSLTFSKAVTGMTKGGGEGGTGSSGAKAGGRTDRASGPVFKTTKEATAAAERLGFERIKETSSGQAVFSDGRRFITRDVDGHNGGAWKMADSVKELGSKRTRTGTYDIDLSRIGD